MGAGIAPVIWQVYTVVVAIVVVLDGSLAPWVPISRER